MALGVSLLKDSIVRYKCIVITTWVYRKLVMFEFLWKNPNNFGTCMLCSRTTPYLSSSTNKYCLRTKYYYFI